MIEDFRLGGGVPQFIDYLRGGWQISFVVAIDYTASNGDSSSSSSLHYRGSGENQYEKAIKKVGNIIEPYDLDKSFPVFGFGGIPKHMGEKNVSHCFPLNGNMACPEVAGGIQEVLKVYENTLE